MRWLIYFYVVYYIKKQVNRKSSTGTIEPRLTKKCLQVYAKCTVSDNPAHRFSVISIFSDIKYRIISFCKRRLAVGIRPEYDFVHGTICLKLPYETFNEVKIIKLYVDLLVYLILM